VSYPRIDLTTGIVLMNVVSPAAIGVPIAANFASIATWKPGWTGSQVYVEFVATNATVLGDGSVDGGIGLFGGLGGTPPTSIALIGVLGLQGLAAGAYMPQVPFVANGAGSGPTITRWGQIVQDVSIYDCLAVRAATKPLTLSVAADITVTAYRVIGSPS